MELIHQKRAFLRLTLPTLSKYIAEAVGEGLHGQVFELVAGHSITMDVADAKCNILKQSHSQINYSGHTSRRCVLKF